MKDDDDNFVITIIINFIGIKHVQWQHRNIALVRLTQKK